MAIELKRTSLSCVHSRQHHEDKERDWEGDLETTTRKIKAVGKGIKN